MDFIAMQRLVQKFCEERDWDQFHGPKDLAIGIVTEGSELLDLFRFKSDEDAFALLNSDEGSSKIRHELADVLFFLLRFAQRFDIDLPSALNEKLKLNAEKYPVEKARGSNKKYNEN